MFNFIAAGISANILYLAIPLILLVIVISAVYLDKKSIPVIVVALFAGLIFGANGLGFWKFNNMQLTNKLANLALVFVLFHGGFCTKSFNLKKVALPALGLASWGVILTAIFTFMCLYFILGWDRNLALLLSVIISSTDAAAIFSILSKQPIGHKLASTIEIESAANDPMAIMLTAITVEALATGAELSFGILTLQFLWKFIAAPVIGFVMAKAIVWLINKLTPQETGYYHIILLCTALLIYGIAETVNASGILATFTAGIVMGNAHFVHKQGVYNFSSSIATISNILLFVLLGVLVEPSRWFEENFFIKGILLFLFLSFIARPMAVFLGTPGMRIPIREKLFIAWAGLRGAVPIVLATYPTAKGSMENGIEIFNMVFFVVLLSLLIQGSSLGKIAKLLKLTTTFRPEPPYSLEFFTKNVMEAGQKITVFTISMPDPEGCKGPAIKDIKLPESVLLLMIARRRKHFKIAPGIFTLLKRAANREKEKTKYVWQVLPPRGGTILRGWDQVTILSKVEDQKQAIETLLDSFKKGQHSE